MEMIEVITNPCFFCGSSAIVIVSKDGFDKWQAGELVQKAFPEMSPAIREMLITGTHPECWEEMWGGTDESI